MPPLNGVGGYYGVGGRSHRTFGGAAAYAVVDSEVGGSAGVYVEVVGGLLCPFCCVVMGMLVSAQAISFEWRMWGEIRGLSEFV